MPNANTPDFYRRSGITMADLRDRVRSDVGLTDDSFIADDDIDRWGLEGQRRIAAETRWLFRVENWVVSGGVVDIQIPDDLIALQKVLYDSGAGPYPLAYLTEPQLYDLDPYWRTSASGTPLYYSVMDNSRIIVYPSPNVTDPDNLQLQFSARPPDPVGDLDLYYVPGGGQGEDCLVNFVLWRLSTKDLGREGARRTSDYRASYELDLKRLKGQLAGMATENILQVGSRKHRPFYSSQYRIDRWGW